MGIETAFLLGFFLGYWLTTWILWRASLKVLKILASMERDSEEQQSSGTEIICVTPIDNDNDW
jgi:hypothetical protein